jgi:hypothetical protein
VKQTAADEIDELCRGGVREAIKRLQAMLDQDELRFLNLEVGGEVLTVRVDVGDRIESRPTGERVLELKIRTFQPIAGCPLSPIP